MTRRHIALIFLVIAALGATTAVAEINTVTPSTNDENRDLGWAHVNVLDVGVGYITLEFVSTRSFLSCFEYRTDGDMSQKTSDTNYNSDITDGLYPFTCVNNSTGTKTLTANEYVEVRMVFGAEGDERFDWTRFDVLQPIPVSVEIKPEMLNLKSKGLFTAFIELPEGYDDIDLATVECEGAPAIEAVRASNGKLLIKFDREDLEDVEGGDAVELTVTGELLDGSPFAGSDTIRVKG